MIILDATTKSVEAVLAAEVAASQPTYIVSYIDRARNQEVYGSRDGALNGTTDVTILPAPASGYIRCLKSASIYNRDTADVSVQVHYDSGGVEYEIIKVTLAAGSTLMYTEAGGWMVITADGEIIGTSGTGGATAALQAAGIVTLAALLSRHSELLEQLVVEMRINNEVLAAGLNIRDTLDNYRRDATFSGALILN